MSFLQVKVFKKLSQARCAISINCREIAPTRLEAIAGADYLQCAPHKLSPVNTFMATFTMKFFLYVCIALWLILANVCCPETKIVCLESFLARKKETVCQMAEKLCDVKILKIHYHNP